MLRRILIAVASAAVLCGGPAAASERPEKEAAGPFVPLPALTAGVIRADGRRGVLTVENGLDVADPALRARAAASVPRLRDAYTRYLGVYGGSLTPGRPPDPDAIASGLQRATDQVLGRPGARVLLGTLMIN